MALLPPADNLFHTFFAPWYPQQKDGRVRLQADLEQVEFPEGVHLDSLNNLNDEGRNLASRQLNSILQAGRSDIGAQIKLRGAQLNADYIKSIDAHFQPKVVESIIGQSDNTKYANPYLVVCCEIGAMVGEALRAQRPELQWVYDLPYWDSFLFDLNSKVKLNVFFWAVRRLSGEGDKQTLSEKMQSSLDFIKAHGG
jgi:hypothetical protein